MLILCAQPQCLEVTRIPRVFPGLAGSPLLRVTPQNRHKSTAVALPIGGGDRSQPTHPAGSERRDAAGQSDRTAPVFKIKVLEKITVKAKLVLPVHSSSSTYCILARCSVIPLLTRVNIYGALTMCQILPLPW